MVTTALIKPELTSDAIHNRNCYAYFLQLKPLINSQFLTLFPRFRRLHEVMAKKYNQNYPYGDLYSSYIAALEELIENSPAKQIKFLDDLVLAIYHNDNHILEKSSNWINNIGTKTRPQKSNPSTLIKKEIKDSSQNINHISPSIIGGLSSRLYSLFSKEFKPQLETNVPTIKNYSYKKGTDLIEYRFSTQAQRHQGRVRISPLFKRWLQIKAEKSPPEQSVCHIYFNNLALDRGVFDFAGSIERRFTLKLHELELDPTLKVLVITLPANEGLMKWSDYKFTKDSLSVSSIFNEFLEIAKGKASKSRIADFKMSTASRQLLFGTPEQEHQLLTHLLVKSFKAQGLTKKRSISTAEKQAVWVHFIKYELINYILESKFIKPQSFNFSCKDAIDRGALSSSYYNLLRSLELNQPITRDEFELSIDAAAANVKGRGMNFHRNIMWNALNVFVNANYPQLIADKKKSWLIYWRDMNCPHIRTEELLKIRLKQTIKQFYLLSEEHDRIKKTGLKLLGTVTELDAHQTSGKRLMLEVVSRTSALINASSKNSMLQYIRLAEELVVEHPVFYIIGGIMEVLIGMILYIPTVGFSQNLIIHGAATANTGFFATKRLQLVDEMVACTRKLNQSSTITNRIA